MKLKYDLHTHTVFSHGKGAIEDNVKAAIAAGLETIGISDHGPGHVSFGVKHSDFPVMRAETDRLQRIYPQIRILLGVEANIIDDSGLLDITPEEEKLFDYINAGYHYGVFGRRPFHAAGIHCANLLWELKHSAGAGNSRNEVYAEGSKDIKTVNTELAIKAIKRNTIMILTHPGAKADVYIEEIAKACAERGTLMEINDGHGFLSVEGIKAAAATDVRFVISSDAHTPERVGHFRRALQNAKDAGLDLGRIVNLEE